MLYLGNGIAEKGGQRLRHLRHAVKPPDQRLAADPLQRIIEEMRIDLVLQRQIFRLFLRNADQIILVNHFI